MAIEKAGFRGTKENERKFGDDDFEKAFTASKSTKGQDIEKLSKARSWRDRPAFDLSDVPQKGTATIVAKGADTVATAKNLKQLNVVQTKGEMDLEATNVGTLNYGATEPKKVVLDTKTTGTTTLEIEDGRGPVVLKNVAKKIQGFVETTGNVKLDQKAKTLDETVIGANVGGKVKAQGGNLQTLSSGDTSLDVDAKNLTQISKAGGDLKEKITGPDNTLVATAKDTLKLNQEGPGFTGLLKAGEKIDAMVDSPGGVVKASAPTIKFDGTGNGLKALLDGEKVFAEVTNSPNTQTAIDASKVAKFVGKELVDPQVEVSGELAKVELKDITGGKIVIDDAKKSVGSAKDIDGTKIIDNATKSSNWTLKDAVDSVLAQSAKYNGATVDKGDGLLIVQKTSPVGSNEATLNKVKDSTYFATGPTTVDVTKGLNIDLNLDGPATVNLKNSKGVVTNAPTESLDYKDINGTNNTIFASSDPDKVTLAHTVGSTVFTNGGPDLVKASGVENLFASLGTGNNTFVGKDVGGESTIVAEGGNDTIKVTVARGGDLDLAPGGGRNVVDAELATDSKLTAYLAPGSENTLNISGLLGSLFADGTNTKSATVNIAGDARTYKVSYADPHIVLVNEEDGGTAKLKGVELFIGDSKIG